MIIKKINNLKIYCDKSKHTLWYTKCYIQKDQFFGNDSKQFRQSYTTYVFFWHLVSSNLDFRDQLCQSQRRMVQSE